MKETTVDLSRRGVLALGLGVGLTAATATAASAAETVAYQYRQQATQSWCSAASSRIALTARGLYPSQASLADSLGLVNGQGLQDPYAIARVLNDRLGIAGRTQRYYFRQPPVGTLKERLRSRVKASINAGYPVVINMDRVNNDYFSAGHYIAIVGYRPDQYKIADPYTPVRDGVWRNEDNIVAWNKMNRFTAYGA
ncbi:C39 family peptidase [Thalassiella azotivora]